MNQGKDKGRLAAVGSPDDRTTRVVRHMLTQDEPRTATLAELWLGTPTQGQGPGSNEGGPMVMAGDESATRSEGTGTSTAGRSAAGETGKAIQRDP